MSRTPQGFQAETCILYNILNLKYSKNLDDKI